MSSKRPRGAGAPGGAGREPDRTTASRASASDPARSGRAGAAQGWMLDLALVAIAAVHLVLLWRQAAPAAFSSDECFHAYLAEWIAAHRSFPRELPEFYSGLPYFYPPLFHLLGAALHAVAGPDSLRYLNVLLTGALVVVLRALPIPGVPAGARRTAVLVVLATPALSFYAVRFYAEALATLLAVLVTVLLLRLHARPGSGTRAAVGLGLAAGAALLAKQPALLLPVLLALLTAIHLARGARREARAMAVALGVALLVALPFFARNQILFGSPLYPPLATDAQRALDAMNRRLFTLPPPVFYRNAVATIGPLVVALAAGTLGWRVVRGRLDLVTGLLAACFAFVAIGPLIPMFQPRHLNPVTTVMGLLAAIALFGDLRRFRWAPAAVQIALLGWAAFAATRLTGLRAGLDAAPGDRAAYRAIAEQVPAGAVVLSRLTYDTFYYSRRPATWPVPWGPSARELALFAERDPQRFLATLDRLGIRVLLIPRRASGSRFVGVNVPESVVGCVASLVEAGRLRVLWGSADLALVARTE